MEPSSFDVLETVVFPVVGGIIAGAIVVIIELVIRYILSRRQYGNAIKAIEKLFGEWESRINDAVDLLNDNGEIYRDRGVLQFLHHRYFIKRVPLALAAWSKNFSEQQTDELTRLIFDEEQRISVVPHDKILLQDAYDQFFRKAREIDWLDF